MQFVEPDGRKMSASCLAAGGQSPSRMKIKAYLGFASKSPQSAADSLSLLRR